MYERVCAPVNFFYNKGNPQVNLKLAFNYVLSMNWYRLYVDNVCLVNRLQNKEVLAKIREKWVMMGKTTKIKIK